MAYAQAGDEQQRQLDPNSKLDQVPTVDASFAQYLADQRTALAQTQQTQQSFNQNYAPTGTMGSAISGLADVSNLPTGVNPLEALQPYNSALAQQASYGRSLNQQAQTQSSTILNTLLGIKQAQEDKDYRDAQLSLAKQQFALDAVTKGISIDENGVPVVLQQLNKDAVYDKIDKRLNDSSKGKIADTVSFLKDTQEVLDLMEEAGVGDPSMLQSLGMGTTGPLAKIFGSFLPNNVLREKLNTIREKIRKDLYGTVFTKNEQKGSVLPGAGVQEKVNLDRLNSLKDQKLNQVVSQLKISGLTDQEIEVYLSDQGIKMSNDSTKDNSEWEVVSQ